MTKILSISDPKIENFHKNMDIDKKIIKNLDKI